MPRFIEIKMENDQESLLNMSSILCVNKIANNKAQIKLVDGTFIYPELEYLELIDFVFKVANSSISVNL